MFQEELLKVISGKRLNLLFNSKQYRDLISSRIIYGPSNSVDKVTTYYGVEASSNGSTIKDIVEIRELLFNISNGHQLLNSLVLTAPHTHWKTKSPIIYLVERDYYIIGAHNLIDEEMYIPVSFIFGQHSPIPYEWISSSSIKFDEKEIIQCISYVKELNKQLENKDIPLGIAIDFRFKETLTQESIRSIEIPDKRNPDFSTILNGTVKIEELEGNVEQVSWHALSDRIYGFNEKELSAINDMRAFLNNIEDNNKQIEWIKLLQDNLSRDKEVKR